MKNRGSDFRKKGQLEEAIKHFKWAMAINPKCTTCIKDLGEVLLAKKDFAGAEREIRKALDLLEGKDSDALFTVSFYKEVFLTFCVILCKLYAFISFFTTL